MHDNDFTEMEIAMAYGGDYNVGGCRVDGDVKKALNERQRMSEAARLAVAFADALIQELNYRKDLDNENQ